MAEQGRSTGGGPGTIRNTESSIRNPIEVAAGLVFRHGRLLITQRYSGVHLGGLWEFPGGKRKADETFEACLRRELEEEVGIKVAIHDLIESITHSYPEKAVLLNFYRCRWLENEPRPLGCEAVAWVDRHQLVRYSFPAADARLLQKLEASPGLWLET